MSYVTQEYMNKVFQTSLGLQCNSLFSIDNHIFIRYEEAINHKTQHNITEEIIEWWDESEKEYMNLEPELPPYDFII